MAQKTAVQRAKELDFKSEEALFFYIITSYINGQISQMKEIFYSIDFNGRRDFLYYLRGSNFIEIDKKFDITTKLLQ